MQVQVIGHRMALKGRESSTQERNLPHLRWKLSIHQPIRISVTASNMRAPNMMVPASAGLILTMSV